MAEDATAEETEEVMLLTYLVQQRKGLKNAAYGLTEEEIRLKPTTSALSVGGLLKHAAATERAWTATMLGRPDESGEQAYVDTFSLTAADTLDALVNEVDQAARDTEAAVDALADLNVRVQLPVAPWFSPDPNGVSARWILLHLIEELARHAGHADIIREHIDGATTFELLAAVEGWPETDWIKPWRPAAHREPAAVQV